MKIHIVKKGDTLFDLSKKYQVPLQKLIEANPQIVNPDQLNLGDKVKIPSSAVPVDGEGANVYKHTVKQGDSLWKLAKAWGLPLQSLIQANPQLSDPNVLKVGEVVNIPTQGQNAPSDPPANENNANQAPIVSGPTGKKNTAPIAGGQKPEQTKPIPAPAPAPVPLPAPAPENVEPPKPAPVPVPIQVEIDVEHITYEPIQYENIKIEHIKAEEPCPPKQEYPVLPSPYHYQVEQPVYIAPAHTSSPCGCSDKGPKMENENLFYQYPMHAEMVSSYYDFPQMPQEQVMGMQMQHSFGGEYPGISNAPFHQAPVTGYSMEPCPEHLMDNKHYESPWQHPLMGENYPHHSVHPNEMYGGMHHQQGYGWPIPYGPSTCCGPQAMPIQDYHHEMMYPNAMHPNAMHPNAMHPNAMHPNAMHPNAMHPNAMHPNAMHPNAMHPNAMHPNAMHPNAMNPYGYAPAYQEPYGVMGEQVAPGMPGMSGMQGMSGMPGMFEMPGMSEMPGMAGMSGMPGVAGIPVQPNVPMAPLGGFGVPEPVLFDRNTVATELTGTVDQQSLEGSENVAEVQSKVKTKGKKDVKVSGSAVSGKTNKKRSGSSSGSSEKKERQATGRARNSSENRNPWIKE
ncbi:LysM peptidoglycan-binding domain-containing protein [Paenibacillus vini]|uniref:LysM domain-containing protein n=1 Tax=Paenibacillus vini TaxID=1476024 RepID=A0ABQ4MG51_9BACL|nr:LysM peptidoglycan-binding domain-containing protein [Paenibacillus vini]GIP54958.1 hypothetical protein J42TS3_39930 [Paenibacillus vini]